ncbi:hypothetical protein [Hoeflea halophila]|uniref:hypothetical protein n=1 Tax=Hoeflea halophila TaxID=714899 RepID=UPI000BE2CFD1|nr:hypothetical protein [Hoeflea halophila]
MLQVMLLSVAALLYGCSTPYRTPIVEYSGENTGKSFEGIMSYAAQGDLRVVWLHGMCTHSIKWALERDAFISGTLRESMEAAESSKSSAGGNQPYRVTRNHSVSGNHLEMRYLVWSALNDQAKAVVKSASFSKYERADINAALKEGLIDDCFSDAVVYSGPAGDPIRNWIRGEVCDALGGAYSSSGCRIRDNTDRHKTIFVAESLGSKILSDALISIWDLSSKRDKAEIERRLAEVQMIFLLANQIPLLSAATHSSDPTALKMETRDTSLSPLVELFAAARTEEKARSFIEAPGSQLKFVAFSDPNDLLSYPLVGGEHLPQDISIANVIVSNDTTFLGKLERPDTAHRNYLSNPAVIGAVFDGYDGVAFSRRSVPASQ